MNHRAGIIGGLALLCLAVVAASFALMRGGTGVADEVVFRCPEDYEDRKEYVGDVARYIAMREKQVPGITADDLMAERAALMESHGCKGLSLGEVDETIDESFPLSELASPAPEATPRVIDPNSRSISLFGRLFGPYSVTKDADNGVATAYYQGDEIGDGLMVSFFLPGVYAETAFTAKSVADSFREQLGSLAISSFEAPDFSTGKDAYYLTVLDVQEEQQTATVLFIKIGTMPGSVYGIIYRRDFPTTEDAQGRARAWIVRNAVDVFSEVAGMIPDTTWLATLK